MLRTRAGIANEFLQGAGYGDETEELPIWFQVLCPHRYTTQGTACQILCNTCSAKGRMTLYMYITQTNSLPKQICTVNWKIFVVKIFSYRSTAGTQKLNTKIFSNKYLRHDYFSTKPRKNRGCCKKEQGTSRPPWGRSVECLLTPVYCIP